MEKKRFFTNHSKSSAMVVSLAIHAILIVVAISFVAVKVIIKEEHPFEAKRVKRPKMPPRKIQVPVDVKKRKPKPRLRKRIVVNKSTFTDIKMPEISGIKGGLGNMGGDGLGSMGFDVDIGTLFGGNSSGGNELVGTFYDLKVTKSGKPTKIATAPKQADALYFEALNNFAKGWNKNRLDIYFKAPQNKYASAFMIPRIAADAAPKAYGVENVVQPKHWVAFYEGKISAPETGHYRFCGLADDVLLVRVHNRLVIDASYPAHAGKITPWTSDDENNRIFPLVNQHMVIGDWFKLTKGRPEEIEILLGECPGGKFYCQLLIEKKGATYQQASYSYKIKDKEKSGTRNILPVFTTKEIPKELISQMKINPKEATIKGPTFGVIQE